MPCHRMSDDHTGALLSRSNSCSTVWSKSWVKMCSIVTLPKRPLLKTTAKSVVPVMLAPCFQVGHYNLVFALHRQPMRGTRFKKIRVTYL